MNTKQLLPVLLVIVMAMLATSSLHAAAPSYFGVSSFQSSSVDIQAF